LVLVVSVPVFAFGMLSTTNWGVWQWHYWLR
jgi:hypothetical protein